MSRFENEGGFFLILQMLLKEKKKKFSKLAKKNYQWPCTFKKSKTLKKWHLLKFPVVKGLRQLLDFGPFLINGKKSVIVKNFFFVPKCVL